MTRTSRGISALLMVSSHHLDQGIACQLFLCYSGTDKLEIAHNLESAHNASHEFYFSSIAEEYLVRFAALLKNIPSPPIAIGQ